MKRIYKGIERQTKKESKQVTEKLSNPKVKKKIIITVKLDTAHIKFSYLTDLLLFTNL